MSLSTNATFNPILSEALNKIGENRFVGTQVLPVRNVNLKMEFTLYSEKLSSTITLLK